MYMQRGDEEVQPRHVKLTAIWSANLMKEFKDPEGRAVKTRLHHNDTFTGRLCWTSVGHQAHHGDLEKSVKQHKQCTNEGWLMCIFLCYLLFMFFLKECKTEKVFADARCVTLEEFLLVFCSPAIRSVPHFYKRKTLGKDLICRAHHVTSFSLIVISRLRLNRGLPNGEMMLLILEFLLEIPQCKIFFATLQINVSL